MNDELPAAVIDLACSMESVGFAAEKPPVDLTALAHCLVTLRAQAAELAQITRAVEAAVVAAMPNKTAVVPGVGMLERRSGRTRKLPDKETSVLLAGAVAAKARWDPETGAQIDTLEDLERSFLDAFTGAARLEWKLGGLKAVGFTDAELDKYYDWVEGRPTVQITPEATP